MADLQPTQQQQQQTPRTILCHGCFAESPYLLPYTCDRGHCQGSARYCSTECRDLDGSTAHSLRRCHFLGQQRRSMRSPDFDSGVQIVKDDEGFPEYAEVLDANMSGSFEPTGRDIYCQIGETGRIALFPDQIDACGSVIVRLDRFSKEEEEQESKHILCDVDSLCNKTSTSMNRINQSETVQSESLDLWMQGVRSWYNGRDYLQAMKLFEESLDVIVWENDRNERDTTSSACTKEDDDFYVEMLLPPPLRTNEHGRRQELARRAYFLGACLLDAERIREGRKWLMRSLRTIPTWDDHARLMVTNNDSTDADCLEQNTAAMELALSFEEEGRYKMARNLAEWTMEVGIGGWSDAYQRPGYLYSGGAISQDFDWSRPHYSRDDTDFPSWCKALERESDIILDEFYDFVRSKGKKDSAENGNDKRPSISIEQPIHWPKVGSGEHRASGTNDHRVVGGGGDWREHVLFGSGACNSNNIAPKTKALIRKYAQDAVTLAESGGGEVIFSVLAPGTRIAPHCASTNVRLTAHLGLVVPTDGDIVDDNGIPKCGIRVADEWHTWRSGEILVFDDSFEHEVRNVTSQVRAVLLFRFWNQAIPIEKRETIMAQLRQMKALESTSRRYNPPLLKKWEAVERRGLGMSQCSKCLAFGHDSITLVEGTSFECSRCGERIAGQ